MTSFQTARVLEYLKSESLRLCRTTSWSLTGFQTAWQEEKSLRQWFALNLISLLALVLGEFSTVEAAIIVAFGALVIVVELINSAIEATVDYISVEKHPLAKKAKDIASAAVMGMALIWLCTWGLVAIDHMSR